jgi:hypothetical protein
MAEQLSWAGEFTKGYAIGSDMRKRYAVNKYLKELEKLTKASEDGTEDPEDTARRKELTTQIADAKKTSPDTGTVSEEVAAAPAPEVNRSAAIPGTMAPTPDRPEVPVRDPAAESGYLETTDTDYSTGSAKSRSATAAPGSPDPSLRPGSAPRDVADPSSYGIAADSEVPTAALPAVVVSGKKLSTDEGDVGPSEAEGDQGPPRGAIADAALPIGGEGAVDGGEVRTPRKSITRDQIKNLDRLAMRAARISGDIGVYHALQQTTDSYLQGKLLSNLSQAAIAWDNNDMKEAKFRFENAYSFFPDGQHINLKERDGKLWVRNPGGKGEEIELTSDIMMSLGQRATDPVGWRKAIRDERVDAAKGERDDRKIQVSEDKNTLYDERTQAEDARNKANDPYTNLKKWADANAAGGKEKGKSESGLTPPQELAAANAGTEQFMSLVTKTVPLDPAFPERGTKKVGAVPGFEEFSNPDGSLTEEGIVASGLAGQLAIANSDLAPIQAAQGAAALLRALAPPVTVRAPGEKSPPVSDLHVSPKDGTITLTISGQPQTFNAPEKLINTLISLEKKERARREKMGISRPRGS